MILTPSRQAVEMVTIKRKSNERKCKHFIFCVKLNFVLLIARVSFEEIVSLCQVISVYGM